MIFACLISAVEKSVCRTRIGSQAFVQRVTFAVCSAIRWHGLLLWFDAQKNGVRSLRACADRLVRFAYAINSRSTLWCVPGLS
jgi:hypothetical protein